MVAPIASSAEKSSQEALPPAYKIKSISQIEEDVYLIQGKTSSRKAVQKNRNMVILRRHVMGDQYELTLINPIRIEEDDMEELNKLGKIYSLIRLGSTIGECEDQYYLNKYSNAIRLAPGNASMKYKLPIHHLLTDHSFLLDERTQIFIFKGVKQPEAALLLRRPSGNILVTSESLQSDQPSRSMSFAKKSSKTRSEMIMSPMVIPPGWVKNMSTKQGGSLREEFERLSNLDFSRQVGASGNWVDSHAKESTVLAVNKYFRQSE
jgi:hypothetical protein